MYCIQQAASGVIRWRCVSTVQAHHEPVSHLKCGEGYVISGSADHLVKVIVITVVVWYIQLHHIWKIE